MKKIAKQLTGVIKKTERTFENDSNYNELKEAVEQYNELIKLGVIKKRGYGLMSIDQTDIKQPTFNSIISWR